VVLIEVLVLEGHVAVINRDSQLPLTQEPLLCQVIVDLVPCLYKMVWFSIFVQIIPISN